MVEFKTDHEPRIYVPRIDAPSEINKIQDDTSIYIKTIERANLEREERLSKDGSPKDAYSNSYNYASEADFKDSLNNENSAEERVTKGKKNMQLIREEMEAQERRVKLNTKILSDEE